PPTARDQIQAICEAVRELQVEGPGDILVFLSGEREIRDAADALRELELQNTEILPLYARLSSADQHRVFASHRGRRIVLATNVAETSLTVPGIRYVVDPGTARISRYSHRLKVQRLPIEAISQASANQRAGRCGRVAPGICIRLYSQADYDDRPAFTDPEILRTNLASVILQMTSLGLGDLAVFPFVEPPDRRAVADGIRLLQELGALELTDAPGPPKLTAIGRQLARLPVDPRFGRMVLEAERSNCLREVLIIAAALSIEDPRERPSEHAPAADQFHARFADPSSDFLAYLNLWRYAREQQRELSSNQFRRRCRAEYLNHLRLREWQDVHSQLRHVVGELGMRLGEENTNPDDIHRALLSGLLSHIGMRDRETREFRGARNMRFAIFPGSTLAKKPPQWVMAAELVETSRLFARRVARIQPEWAERLGAHLLQYSYSEPHWSRQRGAAMAYESVSLYGLPIVTRRLVNYGRVDPEHARELFIRHALVDAEWDTHYKFPQLNRDVLDEVIARGHRFRRVHVLADDSLLENRYNEILGPEVVSARHFDSWWKKVRRTEPDLLTFTAESLLGQDEPAVDESQFPARWEQGSLRLPMSYVFEPGTLDDGPMVHIPLAVLNQVEPAGFDWQVPGLREELADTLVRALPKPVRKQLLPLAETVRTALASMDYAHDWRRPFTDVLGERLGGSIPHDAWAQEQIPVHLRVRFRVEDAAGNAVAEGSSIAALQELLAPKVRAAVAAANTEIGGTGHRRWAFGELPKRVQRTVAGQQVVGYPALVDEGDTVGLAVFESEAAQREAMWTGTRRLLRLATSMSVRTLRDRLTEQAGLALTANPYASAGALLDDVMVATLDSLMAAHGGPAWNEAGFDRLRGAVAAGAPARALAIVDRVAEIFTLSATIDRKLRGSVAAPVLPAQRDMAQHRASLLHPGFVGAVGARRLDDLPRYLRGIVHRLDSVPKSPGRDRERMQRVHRLEATYSALAEARRGSEHDVELEAIGWMIEELRISLFAQHLGTAGSVSEPKIQKALDDLRL
ncbi:MAG: ATP-dependent helicase HrpA, partial [Acidimicrobiia bacterium]|nr:ATP-dependent helicase HrpA [Acidimicrobiia bacterium]